MKNLKLKCVVGLLVLCAMTAALIIGYAMVNLSTDSHDDNRETELKLKGIGLTLSNLCHTQKLAISEYMTQLGDNVELMSLPLREIARREGDGVLRAYEDSFVLRVDGDGFVLPEGAEGLPLPGSTAYAGAVPVQLEACEPFKDGGGAFWTYAPGGPDSPDETLVLCVYRRLYDQYYYVHYAPASELTEFVHSRADESEVLRSAESVYDCLILAGIEEDGDLALFYASEPFTAYDRASELGVSIDGEGGNNAQVTVDGADYLYSVSERMLFPMLGDGGRVVYVIPYSERYGRATGKIELLMAVPIVIFIMLFIWVVAAIQLVRREVITESQRARYGASRMRMATALLGIVGFACVLAGSMFTDALSSLYYVTNDNQSALQTLHGMAEETRNHRKSAASQRGESYLRYAHSIAQLLSNYPELQNAERLDEMSLTIGADYLMLFDDNGDETLSNAPYVNLSYGKTPVSSTHDFRRLIKGVPGIVHEARVDETTGLERQLIGVPMDDGDISDGYGSLLMAILPQEQDVKTLSVEDIMLSLTTADSILFAIDQETGLIQTATDGALVGKRATDLGMPESAIRDAFMDFFILDGARWYGCSVDRNGVIYYYAVKTDVMFAHLFSDGLLRGAMFLACYAILALALLAGYTEKNVDDFGGRVVEDSAMLNLRFNSRWTARPAGVTRFTDRARQWWRRKTPEQKAWFALQALVGFGLLNLLNAMRLNVRGDNAMSILLYVFGNRWTHGLNLFAMTRIAVLAMGTVMAVLAIRLLVGLISGMLDTKGVTVCRLVGSIMCYVAVIVALFSAFDSLGFDTNALLASLGFVSLAITLGSKDLVADVLSGILIVFSGEYQIGEIVDIGGFRGRVTEIGVRSTTLVSKEGTIKNIANRNVTNVMNMSRLSSRYIMEVTIGQAKPLEEAEAIVRRDLPGIRARIPGLLEDPEYRGVVSVGSGCYTLSFSAECNEEDYVTVRSGMNVEIKRMLERNGIDLL